MRACKTSHYDEKNSSRQPAEKKKKTKYEWMHAKKTDKNFLQEEKKKKKRKRDEVRRTEA